MKTNYFLKKHIRLSFLVIAFPLLLSLYANGQVIDLAETSLDECPNVKRYSYLEEALKEPEMVVKLDLSMRKLKVLSPEISKLKNLRCLDISYNHLTSLPSELAQLKNLTYISLSGNNYMKQLPSVLKTIPNLKVLDLTDIQLWTPAQYEAAKKMLPNVKIIK